MSKVKSLRIMDQSDEEDAQQRALVYKKLHIFTNGTLDIPITLVEPEEENGGFLVVDEPLEGAMLERGDRLFQVQKTRTVYLGFDDVVSLMIPNVNTGEVILYFVMGQGDIPDNVCIINHDVFSYFCVSFLNHHFLAWKTSSYYWYLCSMSRNSLQRSKS